MPLYCFQCSDCGHKWEEFRGMQTFPDNCPKCGKDLVLRDYQSENKVFFADIAPYFDFSIGQHISGRRDKATKYRAGGYTPVAAGQGGDSVMPEKRFYGDEEYKEKVLDGKPESDKDRRLNDMIAKGMDASEAPLPEVIE